MNQFKFESSDFSGESREGGIPHFQSEIHRVRPDD